MSAFSRRIRRTAAQRPPARPLANDETRARLAMAVQLGMLDRAEHDRIVASLDGGLSVAEALDRAHLDDDPAPTPLGSAAFLH